ncbi:MAG: non-hydrolyzing UDP-N-acetylglucosamine 2-epimerase [Gaiellaceae bacterium]
MPGSESVRSGDPRTGATTAVPPLKVLSVVGNRPQFIKSAPLSLALRGAGIDEVILHTGQHYDPELSQVFFDELRLPSPSYELHVGSGSREQMLEQMQPGIESAIAAEQPDWVLVYGDTNSTLAGGNAAVAAGVPLAHVEAGMRSGDWSMPEEHNRVAVDRISNLLLCPDERSRATLIAEGIGGEIEVVGDVMADASIQLSPLARPRSRVLEEMAVSPGEYLLATVHRQANVFQPRLGRIVEGLNALSEPIVFPAHPRTRATLEREGLRLAAHVRLTRPLGYLDVAALTAQARVVVTDSGGLQKEAYWHGIPCVTLRASTEWVDTVELGANTLVDDDPQRLGAAVAAARMPVGLPRLYGDGRASERIARVLLAYARAGQGR